MKRAFAIIFAMILILGLAGCGGQSKQETSENAYELDKLNSISFFVPTDWERKAGDNSSIVCYPGYEAASVVSVWEESVSDDNSFENEANRDLYVFVYTYDCDDYSPELTEYVTIADCPGVHHVFNYSSNGNPTTCELYAFTSDNQLYAFTSICGADAEDSIKDDLSKSLARIIESVSI